MNQVITLSNKDYFKYGKLFINTRKLVDANFFLYGYGLTKDQRSILTKNDIEYREISKDDFENKMQFLKFSLIKDHIDDSNDGISLIDFDTFFIQDWSNEVFSSDFNLGITVRNSFVKKRIFRAFANGGVIFAKSNQKSKEFMDFALKTMTDGNSPLLAEYDKVFKTLEENRPEHKTWKRSNLRWWVDQVFLSSLVLRYFDKNGYKSIKDKYFFDFNGYRVGLFSCNLYNCLDPNPSDVRKAYKHKNKYVIHMKNKGRNNMDGLEKEVLRSI